MVGIDTMFGVDGMSWVHGRSTLCSVFDGGLGILDYVQWSLTGAFHSFWITTRKLRIETEI